MCATLLQNVKVFSFLLLSLILTEYTTDVTARSQIYKVFINNVL